MKLFLGSFDLILEAFEKGKKGVNYSEVSQMIDTDALSELKNKLIRLNGFKLLPEESRKKIISQLESLMRL